MSAREGLLAAMARAVFEQNAPCSGFAGAAPYDAPRWEDQGPGLRMRWYGAALAALAAIEAHDGGCVVVPREPTDVQITAMMEGRDTPDDYRRGIAASPYAQEDRG